MHDLMEAKKALQEFGKRADLDAIAIRPQDAASFWQGLGASLLRCWQRLTMIDGEVSTVSCLGKHHQNYLMGCHAAKSLDRRTVVRGYRQSALQ